MSLISLLFLKNVYAGAHAINRTCIHIIKTTIFIIINCLAYAEAYAYLFKKDLTCLMFFSSCFAYAEACAFAF